jgi:ribosomal protein L25, Ctc-form
MSETATLKFEIRKELTKSERRRYEKNGYIIGVINQKGKDSLPIAVKKDEFRKVLKNNGRNSILKLYDSDNNSYDVIVKNIDITPLKYDFYHVDFQKVSLDEEIRVDVAVRFLGTDFLNSKRLVINRFLDTIPVTALPKDIPEAIEIDVSDKNDGDIIYVKDLVLGKGIKIEEDPEHMIASISEVKSNAEESDENSEEVVKSVVSIG